MQEEQWPVEEEDEGEVYEDDFPSVLSSAVVEKQRWSVMKERRELMKKQRREEDEREAVLERLARLESDRRQKFQKQLEKS